MPAVQFTAAFVKSVKTDKKREVIRDLQVQGLELRITKDGAKSWCLRYRRASDGRRRRLTIGRYPDFSLSDARTAAEVARGVVARGGDPAGEKQERKAAETFKELSDQWLSDHCEVNLRPASIANYRTALRLYILPTIGGMKAMAVSRRDVSRFLAEAAKTRDARFVETSGRKTRPTKLAKGRRSTVNANRVFATVRAVYRWALGQGLIECDPTWGMKAPVNEPAPRERVLSAAEICRFWHSLDLVEMREADRIMFRLALVTAQRIGEVSGIAIKHLEFEGKAPAWTIPGALTKNGESHKVWLSPLALSLVREAKELSESEDWLFPLQTDDGPMRTPNCVDLLKKARGSVGIEDFRLHDLRRTAATYMGEIGVPDRDIEGILNHISAQRGVTRRHYDKARRESAKREAMLLWSAHLETLIKEQVFAEPTELGPFATRRDMPRPVAA